MVLSTNVEESHAEESANGLCMIHRDIKPANDDTYSLIGNEYTNGVNRK